MRRLLVPLIAATTLWAGPATAQAGDGGLSQLSGRAGCLAAGKDCQRLRPKYAGRRAGGWSVAANGRSAVGILGENAVVAVRRSGRAGGMRQVAGRRGCVAERAGRGCLVDERVRGAVSTALSPDGRHVAVIGYRAKPATCGDGSSAKDCNALAAFVLVLRRDPATGALRRGTGDACVAGPFEAIGTRPGRIPGCADATGEFDSLGTVAFGPEGRSLYVAGGGSLLSLALSSTTGGLSPAPAGTACFVDVGAAPQPCEAAPGLNSDSGAEQVAIPADGKALYVRTPGRFNDEVGAGTIGSIAAFTRDPATGALTTIPAPGGCYESDDPGARRGDEGTRGRANQPGACTAAPLGADIFSLATVGNSLVADGRVLFGKDDSGRLTVRQALTPRGVREILTPPVAFGDTLTYASALSSEDNFPGALAVLGLAPAGDEPTSLSQRAGGEGCLSGTRRANPEAYDVGCQGPARGLVNPTALAVSRDGANAYVYASGRLTAFKRVPANGVLSALGGRRGCAAPKERRCSRSTRLPGGNEIAPGGTEIAVSEDGRRVTLFGAGVWTFRRH